MGKKVEMKNISTTGDIKTPKVFPIKPVSDYIIIDAILVKPSKKNNIILSKKQEAEMGRQYFDEHPYQGKVMAVGNGYVNGIQIKMEVSVGDIVYMRDPLQANRQMIVLDGKTYGNIRMGDVIAIKN